MIEIKKSTGSNIGSIYKANGNINGFVNNYNSSPVLLITAPTNQNICLVNWFFSFGDEQGGVTDQNFYLINQIYLPLTPFNVQNALVCFNVSGYPIRVSGNTYSGTRLNPTYGNCGSDIYLTQIADSTSMFQFIKWTIYYTLIPYNDIYP
jgi:hypothetical protein